MGGIQRMPEPYTIRIFVVDGDPDGVKIVDRSNWTGWGIAFPRSAWPEVSKRKEFGQLGVYILTGPTEDADDDLPTVYVGQADVVRSRIGTHFSDASKDFWDWGYAFVSKGDELNRAHISWIEHALIDLAHNSGQCRLNNTQHPKEPNLAEWERVDTQAFLKEMLRILPVLGVRVFEKPSPVVASGEPTVKTLPPGVKKDTRDTVIVPANEEGFVETFLGEDSWYQIRISGGMLPRIKYVAAYRTKPISAITHYAPVDRIEPYGASGKYRLFFSEHAKEIPPIPLGDAVPGTLQGPRYTNLEDMLKAESVAGLFGQASGASLSAADVDAGIGRG